MRKKSFRKTSKKLTQFGGISIDINESRGISTKEDAFRVFLTNSTYEMLSTSSLNGIIIKATLVGDVVSPYISIRSDSFGDRIKSLIIKLVFVDGPNELSVPKIRDNFFPKTTTTEFTNEVGTQIDIFRESCLDGNALDAICPAIVNFCTIPANHTFLKNFLNTLLNRISYTKENAIYLGDCLKAIYKAFKEESNSSMKLGVIAMECADKYKPLFSFGPSVKEDHPDYKYQKRIYFIYQAYALYELKRLHKLGYVHGDLHQENILINVDTEYFTKINGSPSVLGRAMIIDFDRSRRMNSVGIKFPEGLTEDKLADWSMIDTIEMEIMNTSRKIPPQFIEQGRKLPEGYIFSKLFPDRATYNSYIWMEFYSPKAWTRLDPPKPQPKLFEILLYNIDNEFPKYRKIMVDNFNADVLTTFPDLFDATSSSSLKMLLYPDGFVGPPHVREEGIHSLPNIENMTPADIEKLPEYSNLPKPDANAEYKLFGGKVDLHGSVFHSFVPLNKKFKKTLDISVPIQKSKSHFPKGLTRDDFLKMIRDTIAVDEINVGALNKTGAFENEPINIDKLRVTAKISGGVRLTRKTRKSRKSV